MRLAQKPSARIENVNGFPRAGVAGRNEIGAKDPGMSAGQPVGAFAADLNRGNLNAANIAVVVHYGVPTSCSQAAIRGNSGSRT